MSEHPSQHYRPLIVTSKVNPHLSEAITQTGWDSLQAGGSPLDAAEKAVNLSEIDPRDPTVGYGGVPNEEGYFQLDAAVMSGPDNNDAGAVAALENIKTPSSVARLVMERTDHLMLVGAGALKFAKLHGFQEEDLITDKARDAWLAWKKDGQRSTYHRASEPTKPEGGGTINVLVLDQHGDIAGITSTIGHRYKLVGRVGDSPIIGAGLYVDNAVGAAGATGHGEEAIKVCASFLAVEKMREGMSPQAACAYVCQRIVDRYQVLPLFNVKIVALNKEGAYGCCSLRGQFAAQTGALEGLGFCVHDRNGHRMEAGQALLPPDAAAEVFAYPTLR